MSSNRVLSPRVVLAAMLTVLCAAVAVALFPRAFPTISLPIALSRTQAVARAAEFVRAEGLAPPDARAAARFEGDDRLQTFIELGAGGKDTLAAVVRGRDVALFTWDVRFFRPRSPSEVVVRYAADGRLVGLRRKLADTLRRPTLPDAAARALADSLVTRWGGRDLRRYRLVSTSQRTVPASGRVDRRFTFERTDRTVGGAPIRLNVDVAGDLPAAAREYVVVPERFERRYDEMRASNDFLAGLAFVGFPVFVIAGMVGLIRLGRRGLVRWRPAAIAGAVLGVLLALSVLNELPSSWFDYDTATSPTTFLVQRVALAVVGGAAMAVVAMLLIAMAEALARTAFPRHADWWAMWRHRGTRQVAGHVLGGYALAAFGFAYVAAFYLVTRRALGWWVPSGILDDPNQIATTLPWLAGVASALEAGVLEECLFRAVPLSALAWWAGEGPRRRPVLAAGVMLTALTFAFGHANYPSWPAYSRGVELLLESVLWALVFLRYGLATTVIAHFVYDLVWFELFALSGSAAIYRVTAAVVLVVLLFPALAVAWKWLRQGALFELPPEGRFGAWRPGSTRPRRALPALALHTALTARRRRLAALTVIAALAILPFAATRPTLGPRFTIGRARAVGIADSVLEARGVRRAGWTALPTVNARGEDAVERLFEQHDVPDSTRAHLLAYAPAAWWHVRHVRTAGPVAERREEWRVRLFPDGRVLDVRHEIPEDAPGPTLSPSEARAAAADALRAAGIEPRTLAEVEYHENPRLGGRRDIDIEFADTAARLPAGAAPRVALTIAGAEPVAAERYVYLPEDVRRADRARQDDLDTAAAIAGIVLVTALGIGALLVLRRPALREDAPRHTRRAALAGALALAAWQILRVVNDRPDALAGYDTATPWATFQATLAQQTLLAPLAALPLVGLWLIANEARRRTGVPFWPVGRSPARRAADTLLAGCALGLAPVAGVAVLGRVAGPEPASPSTVMHQQMSLISHVLDTGNVVMIALPLVAVAAIVIAVLGRDVTGRVLALAAAAVLLAPVVMLSEPDVGFAESAIGGGVALALAAVPVALWGAESGAAWLVAALAAATVTDVRTLAAAAAPADRAAAVLGVVAALAGIAAVLALAHRLGAAELPAGAPAADPQAAADAGAARADPAAPGAGDDDVPPAAPADA